MSESPEITKAIVKLLIDHPFWGYCALSLEPVEKKDMPMPTMGTDGRRLFYDLNFVKNSSQDELMGVIAHEIGHIVLYHLPRRQNREPLRWNIAPDFAVNTLVRKEFTLPSGVLYNHEYEEKTAEDIYNHIKVVKVGMSTLDSHDDWDKWDKEGEGEGKGEDGEGKKGGGEITVTGDLEQQWREKVAQAANQARMQGKLPAHLQTVVDGILQPKLAWKEILRDMVTSCAKSNHRLVPPSKKHLWRGIYLPSTTGEELNIGVAIDTSGSISDDEIKEFLSEVKGICDSYENYTIYLFSCDAEIHQRWEIHPFDPLPTVMEGRGGTDFREPLKEAEALPITSFVYLTDLYGTFPDKEPPFPVIWVAVSDQPVPWGQVIRLSR